METLLGSLGFSSRLSFACCLTGDPGYDLDTNGGGDGAAAFVLVVVEGTGGKALKGLIWGFEALEGTAGLPLTVGEESSGEASGGFCWTPFFVGDCRGGKEGGASSSLGETDLTVLTLALELSESLEDVKLILLKVDLTCTTLSNVNFEGLGG